MKNYMMLCSILSLLLFAVSCQDREQRKDENPIVGNPGEENLGLKTALTSDLTNCAQTASEKTVTQEQRECAEASGLSDFLQKSDAEKPFTVGFQLAVTCNFSIEQIIEIICEARE